MRWRVALTILTVVGNLHLALLRAQQRLGHLGHRVPGGELAVQEVTSAWLLHDVRPGEARHLAEAVVTVDDSAVLYPGIGYDEFLICRGEIEKGERTVICSSAEKSHNQFTEDIKHVDIN